MGCAAQTAFQITDPAQAQPGTLGQVFLRERGGGPQLPQEAVLKAVVCGSWDPSRPCGSAATANSIMMNGEFISSYQSLNDLLRGHCVASARSDGVG